MYWTELWIFNLKILTKIVHQIFTCLTTKNVTKNCLSNIHMFDCQKSYQKLSFKYSYVWLPNSSLKIVWIQLASLPKKEKKKFLSKSACQKVREKHMTLKILQFLYQFNCWFEKQGVWDKFCDQLLISKNNSNNWVVFVTHESCSKKEITALPLNWLQAFAGAKENS